MFENLKFFGKAFKKIKTNNQLDLFVTLGTEKHFGPDDKRKLAITRSGKKRWMNADEKRKTIEEKSKKREIKNQFLSVEKKVEKQPYELIQKDFIDSQRKLLGNNYEVAFETGGETGKGVVGEHHKKLVKQAIEEGKIKSHPDYPELTPKKQEELNPEEILKELNIKVWYRGVNTTNENGADKFYSSSKEVASNYSMHKNSDERKYETLKTGSEAFSQNPLVLGSKYDLAEKIGFAEDPYQVRKFDDIAKKYAEKKGHDAIIYLDGTFEEPELHLFGKVKEGKKASITGKMQLLKNSDNFNIREIKNQRFMYNPKTEELILGTNNINVSSHAQEHHQSGAKGKYDDFVRGWIGYDDKKYKNGIIHFAPPIDKYYFNKDEEYADESLKSIEMFIKHGANEGTILRNFVHMGEHKLSENFSHYLQNNETKKSMSIIKIFGKELQPESLSYKSIKLVKAFGQQLGLFGAGAYSREGQTKQGKGGTLQLKRDNTGKGAHWQLMDKKQSQPKTPGQQEQNLPGPSGMQQQGMKLINTDKAYDILSKKLGASLSINDKAGAQIDNGSLQLINVNNDNTISLFYKDKNGSTQIVNAPTNQAVSQSGNSVDFHFADRDISIELNKQQNIATGQEVENKLPSEQAEESSKVAEANRKVDQLLKEASTQRDGFLADLDSIAKDNGLDPHSAEFRQVSLKSKDEFVKDYLDDDGFVNDMLQGAIVADSMDKYTSVVSGLKNKGYEIINEDELKNSDTMNYKSIKVKSGKEDEVVKEVVVANEAMYRAMLNSKAGPNYHRETLYSLDYKVEAEKIPELKAIKDKIYAGTTPGKKEIIITGGLAGSGKSTAIEKRHYKNKVYIDPDDMKNKLYADERGISKDDIRKNPAKYHEESSVLGKHLIREAIRDGRDAFYDATMKGAQNIDDLIKFAKSNGYKVKAKFVHIPLEEGIKRDKARGEAGGRSLGENLYKKLYDGYPTHKVFFSLQDKFDHAELIDNSQPKGEKPKIIQRVNDGKVTMEKKKKLREVKSLAGLLKALRIMLLKAQMNINPNSMFDNNVKDDYITGAKQEGLENMKEETTKNEGMEEKIDPRLFTLLEIEDDGNFDADENSFMLGMLEENGLITHDLKLTPEGEKAYEKEIAELESEDED